MKAEVLRRLNTLIDVSEDMNLIPEDEIFDLDETEFDSEILDFVDELDDEMFDDEGIDDVGDIGLTVTAHSMPSGRDDFVTYKLENIQ